MQGAGNDFVVFDCTKQPFNLNSSQLKRVADRHFGVGCDQILVVEPANGTGADFRYRIFNADGGEVEQCGNGARCFVKFVHGRGFTAKREITVETLGGTIRPRLEADGEVSVDMGRPVLEAPLVQTLKLEKIPIEVTLVSIGNPHAVQFVPEVAAAPVTTQGPLIEMHPRFPGRVNAGYAQVLDRHGLPMSTLTSPSGSRRGWIVPPSVSTRISRLLVRPRACTNLTKQRAPLPHCSASPPSALKMR